MRRLILVACGFCAAAAGLLVWGLKRTPNVEDFSRRP